MNFEINFKTDFENTSADFETNSENKNAELIKFDR